VEAGWRQHGGRVEAAWRQGGGSMEAAWRQRGGRVEAGWRQHGGSMEAAWRQRGGSVVKGRQEEADAFIYARTLNQAQCQNPSAGNHFLFTAPRYLLPSFFKYAKWEMYQLNQKVASVFRYFTQEEEESRSEREGRRRRRRRRRRIFSKCFDPVGVSPDRLSQPSHQQVCSQPRASTNERAARRPMGARQNSFHLTSC